MTTFAQQTAGDDLDVFFNTDEHAQTVTYNGTEITAVDGYAALMGEDNNAVKRVKTLWVKVSDVASPAYRDTVIIDSVTWYVGPEEEFRGDTHTWELPLYRDERPVI